MSEKIEEYLKVIDEVIANGKYKDNWESLQEHQTPRWFENSRLGIFSHWGIFSVPEYNNEWYSRFMYQRMHRVFRHHRKTYGKDFQYRDFIPMFKGEKFDPEKWVELIKMVGADYYLPVAEHHDGFKLHDSNLSEYNSVQMALKRDVIGELKAQCEKNDIVFGCSNHRAEHYFFMNGMSTLDEATRKEAKDYSDFYGPCFNPFKFNNIANSIPAFVEKHETPAYWMQDWLVHACEEVDLYQPKKFYFDWIVYKPEYRAYMKKFLAYYYNRAEQWGEEVCVAFKRDAIMKGCGIYDRERGQLPYICKEKWQCDTSTNFKTWSYCKDCSDWKTAKSLAGTFVDVVSKNGSLLLNICPKADGSFCEEETAALKKFGEWTKKHKQALWDTECYKIYGEGKTNSSRSFNETKSFSKYDYRFTYTTGHIYAFNLAPSKSGKFCIKSFKKGSGDFFGFAIKDVKPVAIAANLKYEQTKKGLEITVLDKIDCTMPICFDVEID